MRTYVLTTDCDCGGEMKCVIGDLSAGSDDEIRINIDLAVPQTTFTCPDCGDKCHTGDFADICFGDDDL